MQPNRNSLPFLSWEIPSSNALVTVNWIALGVQAISQIVRASMRRSSFPGHPWLVDDIAYCANADAPQWEEDWHAHKPKPTNAQPGIEYMLAGGTYRSASDPYATSGTPFTEGPHWIILWPFDQQQLAYLRN